MRCVLDVNVLIAALLSRSGAPARLLRAWLDGAFEVVVSPQLMLQLERVLAYPKIRARVRASEARAFLVLVEDAASLVADPQGPPEARTSDPDDAYLVALAEQARAVIVSGDRHLLSLADRVPVQSPAEFLRFIGDRDG